MNRLKELRCLKGLTQYKLAELTGTYQTKIWLIENEYYAPKEHEKQTLAKILNVDVNDIFPDVS